MNYHQDKERMISTDVKSPTLSFPLYIFSDKYFVYLLFSISKLRGSLNKFPDFFRMGTFIDSTHMKL